MGPVTFGRQMKTVWNYIDIASGGPSAVTGGARLGDEGYFIEPDGVCERRA